MNDNNVTTNGKDAKTNKSESRKRKRAEKESKKNKKQKTKVGVEDKKVEKKHFFFFKSLEQFPYKR